MTEVSPEYRVTVCSAIGRSMKTCSRGFRVITMSMNGKVMRMRQRDRLPLCEIAERTGPSRNTVKKRLLAPSETLAW